MEQEYGEPNAATSLAARTVLPGEPFDAPAASAVPGPRDVPEPQQAPQEQEAPLWNYGPPAELAPPRSFEPATYDPTYGAVVDPHHDPAMYTPTYATADSLTEPDQFESLHQFGALPIAEAPAYPAAYDVSAPPAYPAPDTAPAYPAPPAQSGMPSAFPAQSAPAWPAPPQEHAEPMYSASAPGEALVAPPMPPTDEPPAGEDAEGSHRKSHRRPSTPILVLAAVVVLGGGGYFGYTQLSKSDSNSATSDGPVVVPAKPKTPTTTNPVTPVTPTGSAAYAFPNHVAGFPMRTSSSAAALKRQITSFSKKSYPAFMGTPQINSYGTATTASLVAYSFQPTSGKLAAAFSTMLTGVQKPATGNVVGTFTSVPPGAAGGSMTCGSQTGVSPISYCVWKGQSTVGVVYMKGTAGTPVAQALTRELRAYAER